MSELILEAIGVARTPFKTRDECPPCGWDSAIVSTIQLKAKYRDGLLGVIPQMRICVLWHCHLARRDILQQPSDKHSTHLGVFAMRSPERPNPIGFSIAEVLAVDGTDVHVKGLECVDGTPILDIKRVVLRPDGLSL
jgi:tRNA (adenine37-N6)-methyltransferase